MAMVGERVNGKGEQPVGSEKEFDYPDGNLRNGLWKRVDEFDKEISLAIHGRGMIVPRRVLKLLELSGDGVIWLPVTAAMWLLPPGLLEDPELRVFILNLFVAFVFDLVVIGSIKGVVRRPRPVYNKGMSVVVSVDHFSFPSGHSSRALEIASFFLLHLALWKRVYGGILGSWLDAILQRECGILNEEYMSTVHALFIAVLPWGAVCWALSTAASRVLLGRHYIMDVVVGCIIGVFEAVFVHKFLLVSSDMSQFLHQSVFANLA